MFTLDEATGRLFRNGGAECFDPARRCWSAATGGAGVAVSAVAAATWLQRRSGHRLREPIGVIGPRDAGADRLALAEEIGNALASIGFTVVCGGRQGIMEAVCRGVAGAGGISIGLLPETDAREANPYVTVPLATGIGEARNALVARASFCLVVIGNSYGTLSEVALGLQFGRTVIGLAGAAEVEGVRHVTAAREAVEEVALCALGCAAPPPARA